MLKKYLNLVKFSHTIFAMPFAMVGLFLALSEGAVLDVWSVIAIILCMIFARNSAMGFNRYIDRDIDAKNERTASREIPAGVITPRKALIFIILNSLAFIITAASINSLTLILSPVALFVILGYSLTKRFTWLCHVVLGVGLAIAPSAAYIAVTGGLSVEIVVISLLVLTWVSGFDILYALQDEEFDNSNSLNSIPAYFGRKGALIFSAALHFVTIVTAFFIYFTYQKSPIYLVGAIIFSLILLYEHIIVTPKNISKVNLAFATLNGVGSILYSALTILSYYVKF